MSIRERVAALVRELPTSPEYPTQGATLFIDLERREVTRAYTPLKVVRTLLTGRGGNMFYLYRLLDERRTPLDPEIPLIFGSGVLTGLVPSASRGNATSWSPESGVLMDSNCGDYFPSFLKMIAGTDHLVLYGRAAVDVAATGPALGRGRRGRGVPGCARASGSTTSTCATASRAT
jgi:aldehyde:ferredoxin oxidoreductase